MTTKDTISNKCPRCGGRMEVEIKDRGYYLKCPYCDFMEIIENPVNFTKLSKDYSDIIPKQHVNNAATNTKANNKNALLILFIIIAVIAMFANCVLSYDNMSSNHLSSSTESPTISAEPEIKNKLNYVTSVDDISLINWAEYIPQMKDIFMTTEYNENIFELERGTPECNRAVLLICKDPSIENEFINRLLIVYSQHYRYYDDGPWGSLYMVFIFDNLIIKNNTIELDLYDYTMETYGGNTIFSSSYDDMNTYVQGHYIAQYAERYHINELNSDTFEVYFEQE